MGWLSCWEGCSICPAKTSVSEVFMEQGGGEEGVPDTAFPFWMRSSLPWLPWLFFPQSFGEALPDSTHHIHGYPSSVQQLQGFVVLTEGIPPGHALLDFLRRKTYVIPIC